MVILSSCPSYLVITGSVAIDEDVRVPGARSKLKALEKGDSSSVALYTSPMLQEEFSLLLYRDGE